MEEMAAGPTTTGRVTGVAASGAQGPRDLREWLGAVERIGQLRRITAEVSRNEEMGAITYMAHQEINAPALLFENITDSPRG